MNKMITIKEALEIISEMQKKGLLARVPSAQTLRNYIRKGVVKGSMLWNEWEIDKQSLLDYIVKK